MKLAVVCLLVVSTLHLSAASEYCIWEGTSPVCNDNCPRQFYEVDRNDSGDGATCWTGTKPKCCINIPWDVECYWESSYLFCWNTRCKPGWYSMGRSYTGPPGTFCQGIKTFCCSREF